MKNKYKTMVVAVGVLAACIGAYSAESFSCNFTNTKSCGENSITHYDCGAYGLQGLIQTISSPDIHVCEYVSLSTHGHRGCKPEAQVRYWTWVYTTDCNGNFTMDLGGSPYVTPETEDYDASTCTVP